MGMNPERMAEAVAQAIQMATAPLTARITALEAKPSIRFCGVHEPNRAYVPGDAAVRQGGLWVCRAATTGTPGIDFEGWVLAVKKGTA